MHYDQPVEEAFKEELKKLIQVLKQETLSPELLVYEKSLFSSVHNAVREQQQRIKEYVKANNDGTDAPSHQKNFKFLLYKSETQKIGYLLKQYLRIRLKKIEKYVFYLIKNQSLAEKRLSENQYIYMKGFAELKYRYLQENMLKNLIKSYRGLGGLEVYFSKTNEQKIQIDTKQSRIDFPQPNFDESVFAQIESNPGLLRYNADIEVSNVQGTPVIASGSIIYAPYRVLSSLISESNAELI